MLPEVSIDPSSTSTPKADAYAYQLRHRGGEDDFLLDEPKASSIRNVAGASSLNTLSCKWKTISYSTPVLNYFTKSYEYISRYTSPSEISTYYSEA